MVTYSKMTGPGLHQRYLIQGCDPKEASICLSINQTPQETHLMELKTVSQCQTAKRNQYPALEENSKVHKVW